MQTAVFVYYLPLHVYCQIVDRAGRFPTSPLQTIYSDSIPWLRRMRHDLADSQLTSSAARSLTFFYSELRSDRASDAALHASLLSDSKALTR